MKKILVSLAAFAIGIAASMSAHAQFNPSNGFQTVNNQCGTYFLQNSTYYNGQGVSVGSALPFCAGSMSTQNAGSVQMQPAQYTVATLPTCNASSKALLLVVTDATSPTYNGALTGGGAVTVPVLCNGSAWASH